ncbi:MAG TPA: DNA mismatch endonuclease Vsr, partial [Nitrososphaeraceae archaeon]|nr:DNA mismatch endonuclease Vsr [Nitrososphaeraceae archaeon]
NQWCAMADVHEPEIRSYNMSRIRSKDTRPEILVRNFLYSKGFRYRLNDKKLPGKPDIVFRKYKAVIFVNGCFWHGHEHCRFFRIPKTNTKWWHNKIRRNINNDIEQAKKLKGMGFELIVVWECELKPDKRSETLEKIEKQLMRRRQ